MKSTGTAAALLFATGAVAIALPQGLPPGAEDLPDCAASALFGIVDSTGCSPTDSECLCTKPGIQDSVTAAVDQACSDPADRQKVKDFAAGFCPDLPVEQPTSTTEAAMTEPAEAMTTTMDAASPTGTGMMPTGMGNSTNTTMPTSMPTPSEMPEPSEGAAASSYGLSMSALAVAIAGMTWVFAEL